MARFSKTTNGIGTYTLKNGDRRWRVVYRVNGTTKSKGGFTTKAAAQHWQRHTLVSLDKGEHVDVSRGRTTFGYYVTGWLERLDSDPTIRGNTYAMYEYLLRVHILPTFEHTQFRSLTTPAVRAWHAEMKSKPAQTKTGRLGQSTVAKAYRLLKRILNEAVEDGYLNRNPCQIKNAAVEPKYDLAYEEPPSPQQVAALADAVGKDWPQYRALVLLAGFGGLRWGEAVALKRRHVDLAAGTVRVEEQAVEVNGCQLEIGDPKTDAGRRTVYLHADLVAALRQHMAQHVRADDDALLFTAPRPVGKKAQNQDPNRYLRHANFRRRIWKPATKAVGCPGVRFHDLRHAAATLAAMTGTSTKNLMARMGHASQAAALRYQHATHDQQQEIAARLDALLADTGEATGTDNVVPLRR